MKARLRRMILASLERAVSEGAFAIDGEWPRFQVEAPREPEHGDLASNVAMVLARSAKCAPRVIATAVLEHLDDPDGWIASSEIAGPGFINFRFTDNAWRGQLIDVLAAGSDYGRSDVGGGARVQVEFVSANPTGPLHIGHGRGAATGDALARVLDAAGFDVDREYYVNDAGVQMETLGRSIYARYAVLCGEDETFPEDGYPGDYVGDLARDVFERDGRRWLEAPRDEAVAELGREGGERMLDVIRRDLDAFGIVFDHYTSERALREAGTVEAGLEELRDKGHLYEADGATWFRSTDFGDDKDRAVVKSDGGLTYFAADIGYHREKFRRGYTRVIDVWGADHHGYVGRVRSALEALGEPSDAFAVVLVQMVSLTRDGEPVRMGKRSGEFVALADIVGEVGADLARFFFLMRKSDAQLEFDLELARRQSAENPVFYVQYAYTRIAGIFRQAAERGIDTPEPSAAAAAGLVEAEELALIRTLAEFPAVVEGAALSFEPHRVVFYAQKLAGEFHRFYSRHKCVTDDASTTAGRLLLVRGVQQVIGQALALVGVSAPERM